MAVESKEIQVLYLTFETIWRLRRQLGNLFNGSQIDRKDRVHQEKAY